MPTDLPVSYETFWQDERLACAVSAALGVIAGRWKVLILRELLPGAQRFNQLQRALVGISSKVLTEQLRQMEQDGIIHRQDFAELPLRVEYALTPLGRQLHPVLHLMHQWGSDYLARQPQRWEQWVSQDD
ncbi:transcriptional regulator [Gloeomargarita lithophora Alchichica-D10]|uniref:Transcriptional regulator n=1 Tax=Gloeomargarita lithophora Alchichica-D10 TaxID=1188229 RepID=A0A1J0AA45_9CYAN|nr:helix-turn-helix domain-containing protein [Gloeomargarita lithophora]APB32769.1 transcriptional regulator [Gloeomargarita lithophora Alchichica-D10]